MTYVKRYLTKDSNFIYDRLMKAYSRFLAVWILNSTLFFFANKFFPTSFVLGNAVLIPIAAAILSGFLLTLFTRFAKQILKKVEMAEGGRMKKFLIYAVVNSFGVWVLARLSMVTGFGIPAFYFAIYLGLALCFGQWLLRQLFKAIKLQ